MKWLLLLLITGLISCSPKPVNVIWKSPDVYHPAFKQVLAVGILPENDSSARLQLESKTAIRLNQSGYPCASALEFFGSKGLAALDQETTYTKLCASGFDYVFIIAFIKTPKKSLGSRENEMNYSAPFYYNRIWKYRNAIGVLNDSIRYSFEGILFDLAQLKAIAVLRTQSFYHNQSQQMIPIIADLFIDKMLRKKMLIISQRVPALKAF